MKNTISADLNGVVELRKQLKYMKRNMQAIGAYAVDVIGGHRKALSRGKSVPDGNVVIRALRAKGYDYMDNANSIMEAASKKLAKALAPYVLAVKMNKDNWAEIRELIRSEGRQYLESLQKHWMTAGAGWNADTKYKETKQRIQESQNLGVRPGVSGILTGRTIQSLRIKLKNQRFIKRKG